MYDVSLLPVALAGLVNMIIGFIWYHPKVFGTAWMTLSGLSEGEMEAGSKRMPVMAAIGLVAAMLMAYVMGHFGYAWGVFDWIGAVELAFWIWLGFVVPPLLGSVLWEGKSLKLYFINVGYWFIGMVSMALTLLFLS